jgi:signal transduction histidine kinase
MLDLQLEYDEHRISQVLSNLLTNAIKYSPDGKNVVISTKNDKKEVVVSIQDFGFGIDKEDQQKIFQLFYRTKDKEESKISGFGLGLFISSEIIKKHKGRLWVESEKGKGSIFHFALPL